MPSQSRGAPEPSAGYPPGRGSPRRPPAVPQRAPSAGYPPAPHPTHQPPPPPLQRGGITSGGMPHHGASGGGASGGGAYGGGPGHLLPQSQWDAEYAELCREVAMLEASLDNLRRVQTERKWHDACWLDSMLRMVQSRLQASIDAKNDAAPDPEGALPPEEAMQGMQPAEGAQPPRRRSLHGGGLVREEPPGQRPPYGPSAGLQGVAGCALGWVVFKPCNIAFACSHEVIRAKAPKANHKAPAAELRWLAPLCPTTARPTTARSTDRVRSCEIQEY